MSTRGALEGRGHGVLRVARAPRCRRVMGIVAAGWATTEAHAAQLSWQAPPECPDESAARRELVRALGPEGEAIEAAGLAVTVTREADQYVGQLRLTRTEPAETNTRRLVGSTCEDVLASVVVTAVIALRAEATAPPGVAANSAQLAESPPVASNAFAAAGGAGRTDPPALAPEDEPLPTSSPFLARATAHWSGAIVGDTGSLPRAAFGPTLGFELQSSRNAMRVTALALLPVQTALESRPQGPGAVGAGAQLWLWAVRGAVCRGMGSAAQPSSLTLCTGVEGGRLEGRGIGVSQPRAGHALWLAPHLDVEVRPNLGATPWQPLLGLGAVVPLPQPRFVLRDLGPVHEVAAVVARVRLGIEWSPADEG